MEKQFHIFENYYTMAYLKNLNTFMKEYKLNISIKKIILINIYES